MSRVVPSTQPPALSAWTSPRAWFTLTLVTVCGLILDLWSKSLAFAKVAGMPVSIDRADVLAVGPGRLHTLIPLHPPVVVAPGWLDLTLVLNPGAVFGMGAGRRWVFVVFTFVAIGFCLVLFRSWTTAKMRVAHAAIGLVLAGGLGNLYDRLMFACVRDFLHPLPGRMLPWGLKWPGGNPEVWPYVSNVADALLIVGIGVLALITLKHDGMLAARKEAASAESAKK
ncbi:MAG: signal peptidase II [Phycisphaerales bacterium]